MTHLDCVAEIITRMAAMDCEVLVFLDPPKVPDGWDDSLTCPHGQTVYFRPTDQQIQRYRESYQ